MTDSAIDPKRQVTAGDLKHQATAISNGIGHSIASTTAEVPIASAQGSTRLVAEGGFTHVRETRTMFQDWMGPAFIDIVERATGRRVRAFFSQVSHDPDIALEFFLLQPLAGDETSNTDS